MNYNESRVYLDELSRYGSVLGLDSMRELLHRLGDPQDGLKFIPRGAISLRGFLNTASSFR